MREGRARADARSLFIGRREPRGAIAAEATTAAGGIPRVVWVEGESGIGKTALVRQCLSELPPHDLVWVSGEENEAALAYGVVDQVWRQVGEQPDAVRGAPAHLDAPPFVVGARLLDRLGLADGLVVVVVDNLHWADGASLDALQFVLRRLHAEPLLVVLITQPDPQLLLGAAWDRLVRDHEGLRRISLGGLSPGELVELSRVAGFGALPEDAARRLHDHTGGHPVHARLLLDEVGVEAMCSAVGVLPAPRSVAAMMLGAVAELSPQTVEFVTAGAVLGQRFPPADAATLAACADPAALLDEAIDAGLLELRVDGDAEFVTPLLRGAVYNDLAPSRRRALHTAAASVTSGWASIEHRIHAATPGGDAVLADDLEQLAIEERTAGAVAQAAEHLLLAARVTPDPVARDTRTLEACETTMTAYDIARAATMRTAVEQCRDSPRRDFILGLLDLGTGRFREAGAHLSRAVERAGRGDEGTAARASAGLAHVRVLTDGWEQAIEPARLALAGDVGWGAGLAQHFLIVSLTQAGRVDEARALLETVARTGDGRIADVDVLTGRGIMHLLTDALHDALADLTEAVDRARAGEPARALVQAHMHLGDVHYRLGSWDEALRHVELAVSLARDTGRLWGLLQAHTTAAQVYAQRGQFDAARAHLRSASEWNELIVTWAGPVVIGIAEAVLAQAEGNAEAMLRSIRPLVDGPPSSILAGFSGTSWRILAIEAFLANDDPGAAELLEQLEALVAARSSEAVDADVWRLRGQLAEANGAWQRALDCYAAGVKSSPLPLPAARLHLARGRLLRSRGRRRAAIDHLRSAREGFATLGAAPFQQRCDAELEACGLPAAEDSSHPLELTPAERAVAHLVAQGLSNREVAARQYVSAKTVEYHLGNVFAKLGIRSRRELRDWFPPTTLSRTAS